MATAKCSSLLRFLVCIFIFKDAISHSDLQFNDDLVVKLIDKVESMHVKNLQFNDDLVVKLIDKVESMHVKIDNLEKNNRDLKQSVSTLIGTSAKFRIQIEEFTDRLTEYEKLDAEKSVRIKGLENMLNALTEPDKIIGKEREIEHEADTENDNDESIKDDNRYMIRKEKRQTPHNVAFTAYLDHVIRNLGTDQPVVYNQILLNDGGAYSGKTGIFRVPVSGVYLLSWSATARKLPGEHAYDVWVKLVVNGLHKIGVVAESRDDGDDNQGSNSAVLRLSQGDEVWTSHYSGYQDMFGDDSERTTSFMGVLLYVDQ